MSLGTFVPLTVMGLFIISALTQYRFHIKRYKLCYLIFLALVCMSTIISGGELGRDIPKILFIIIVYLIASSLPFQDNEISFLSFSICAFYSIYAILVIQSIGLDTEYYGRVQIKILGGDIPLDPNIVSANFVFPLVLSMYNTLYSKYKILPLILTLLLFIAIIVSGSRGALLGVIVGTMFILTPYIMSNQTTKWVKFITIGVLLYAVIYSIDFVSTQDNIFGLNRAISFNEDDSGNGRLPIWIDRLELLTSSPIFGYGHNYNLGVLRGMATHNTFLQVFYYGGVFGLFLFFRPIVIIFKRKNVNRFLKLALFSSVFIPIFFLDTLEERTFWNFLIFYELFSNTSNPKEVLLWKKII